MLTDIIRSAGLIVPEIIIGSLILVILVIELSVDKKPGFIFPAVTGTGIVASFIFLHFQLGMLGNKPGINSFAGFLKLDALALVFKSIFLTGALLFVALSLLESKARKYRSEAEYYIIFCAILLGSMFMVMASNLLMIYVSIELVSMASYMLTVFNFDRKSIESGVKYFLFGAVASAFMLYGMSLLYGFTQTLDPNAAEFSGRLSLVATLPKGIALVMTICGFLFKMAVVPFHIWVPDVYEGAPVPLIAFFSTVPKLAGLVIFARFFYLLQTIAGPINWLILFGLVAVATMFMGNLAALAQTDAKRMMGYSSIAHAGYLMIGVLALSVVGIRAVILHAWVYLLMNFLVFMLIEIYSPVVGGSGISRYAGQFRTTPALATLMGIGLISLIGIPPTGGFTSKFLLFSSAWEAYERAGDKILFWLVILGVVNTLISLFYYLRIPYYMAFREADDEKNKFLSGKRGFLGLGILLAFLIIMIFLKPDWLVNIMNNLTFAYRGMTQ